MATLVDETLLFEPNEKQALFLTCPIQDCGYIGSRGGGKSYALLADVWMHILDHGKNSRALIVRKSFPQLAELIKQSHELFVPYGAVFNSSKHVWTFPNKATLQFSYLEQPRDAAKMQGFNLTYVGVDEAGDFPTPEGIDMLRATLRSAHGIPTYFRVCGNFGSVGHAWLKARYFDPAPSGTPFWDEEAKIERVFIHSFLEDNQVLLDNDPTYVDRLEAATIHSPDLYKAWRWGDPNLGGGLFFADLFDPSVHMIEPFRIPPSFKSERSFDWGYSKPFATCFWSIATGDDTPTDFTIPAGSFIMVGELYGTVGGPRWNTGVKWTSPEIARQIMEREEGLKSLYGIRQFRGGPADNSIFDIVNGRSIADEMAMSWSRSNKNPGSRVIGWQKLRQLLAAGRKRPIEKPCILFFNTCRHTARTLPLLPTSEKNPEDVDTTGEDHIADAMRYEITQMKSVAKKMAWRA